MRHALRLPEVAAANLLIGPPFHLSPSLFPCTAASSHSAPPRPPCLAERLQRRDSALSASQRFRRKLGAKSGIPHLHPWHLGDTHLHYRSQRFMLPELLSLTQYRCSRFPSLRQLPRPNLTSSSPPPPSIRSLVGQPIRSPAVSVWLESRCRGVSAEALRIVKRARGWAR